jgi:transcriptional regulator with XRE-family HTH domain
MGRFLQQITVRDFAMKIDKQTSPEAVLFELGGRIARQRIELGITQAEAARRAGVSKRTIERLEAGGDMQATTLVRLLGVLGLSEQLDRLIPAATVSPMEMLRHQTKKRKRAVSKRAAKPKKTWTWGDQR